LPTFVKAHIEALKNSAPLDWAKMFRNFVGQALAPTKEKTRKRLNRRFGEIFQGKKKAYQARVGVCIDTSGSVSDELVSKFFTELDKMSDAVEEIFVVECDSDVRDSYTYKKGSKVEVSGRGGTRYQPAIDFATKKGDVDLIIMLGDGDDADHQLKKPKVPVIWVNPYRNPSDFGRFVKLGA
jgi:predicted metal-dependent peptidase